LAKLLLTRWPVNFGRSFSCMQALDIGSVLVSNTVILPATGSFAPFVMIEPLQKNDEFLADVDSAQPDGFCFWWLGQSGFLLKWQGHLLLFDPYLSDSLTRKYEGTSKPHVRMSELVVDPHKLTGVEVVTSSHNHTDHLDSETLLSLKTANPRISLVIPEANLAFARKRLGPVAPQFVPVDEDETHSVGPFEFTPVAAAHNTVERDEQGRCLYLGYIVKFGDFSVYHSGDTLWHDGLVKSLLPHNIDVAFLPINGNRPERKMAGNFSGIEAAALGRAIGAKAVVPCHYHMFEFNSEEPDEFVAAYDHLGVDGWVMKLGERGDYSGSAMVKPEA
jgi:L-ascorbate metabolism protein UlaG (beta-lactamase superfamily)